MSANLKWSTVKLKLDWSLSMLFVSMFFFSALNLNAQDYSPESHIGDLAFFQEEVAPTPVKHAAELPDAVNNRLVTITNMESGRLLFSAGENAGREDGAEGGWLQSPPIVETDLNYYNRAQWKLVETGTPEVFMIRNVETRRLIFDTGDKISAADGSEGGWLQSKPIVGADANYYNRALWKITKFGNSGAYQIQNVETNRLLFSVGEKPTQNEGGWLESPTAVGADANYYNRALWFITGPGASKLN